MLLIIYNSTPPKLEKMSLKRKCIFSPKEKWIPPKLLMGYETLGDFKTDTEMSECPMHINILIISPN